MAMTSPLPAVEQSRQLLTRAAPLLRLPTSPNQPPEVLPDGSGLRCPRTGQIASYRDGVLDLLTQEPARKGSQKAFNTPFMAWAYDQARDVLLRRVFGSPRFAVELDLIQKRLQVRPGETVLDLACGQGNFTVAWARFAGPEGLVIGLDLSRPMLARAVTRIQRQELRNVLLVRGDALHLPLADSCLEKMNCSGGFHQFPDLPQVLRELARVHQPGGVLTASTFAERPNDPQRRLKRWLKRCWQWHFVPLEWLGEQLAVLGYHDYQWSLPGGWFGYTSAGK